MASLVKLFKRPDTTGSATVVSILSDQWAVVQIRERKYSARNETGRALIEGQSVMIQHIPGGTVAYRVTSIDEVDPVDVTVPV